MVKSKTGKRNENRGESFITFKERKFGEGDNHPKKFRGEEKEGKSTLEGIIKAVNRLESMSEAELVEDFYRLTVHFPAYQMEDQYRVTLRPLLCNKVQELSECVIFEKMILTELSAFYVLSVSEDNKIPEQRVIKIPVSGLPEEREQKIISTVIGGDPQNFYRYVAFLLGENSVIGASEAVGIFDGTGNRHSSDPVPALYEKMLQTAVNSPERFKEIERLVDAVSEDNVIPEGFEKLYQTFKKVMK